jgi:hypothetical protein
MMGTRPFYSGNGSTMVMVPWHVEYGGPLRSDELESLADFILNWKQTALGEVQLKELHLPETDFNDPAILERGKKVFTQSCSSCHLANGLGGNAAHGPELSSPATLGTASPEGLDGEDYIRQSVLNPHHYITPGYEAAVEKHPCGALLLETELQAVSAFLLQ